MTFHERKNALLFEKDGDFNPGWLLFIIFSALGAGASAGCLYVAMVNEKAWPAAVAALSFIAFAMLCTAIIVVPISRAKLLAPALKEAAGGISRTAAANFESHQWASGDPDAGGM
jgi:hypothetical protein